MSSIPTLGYWDIRGLAEPIRYLLRYAGIPFNDKRLQSDGNNWKSDKTNLGLEFPNLPYYIDEDIKLTQSLTILRHLARKHGLVAKDELNLAKQELVEQQIQDMRYSFYDITISEQEMTEEKKSKYIAQTLVPQLKLLSQFLANNEWLVQQLSYVDFLAYETLDWFRLFSPETIESFPNLKQLLDKFENLEPIKAYRSSSDYKSWPLFLNAPIVRWGFDKL